MSDWQNRYQRLLFDRPHPKVLRVTMNRPDKYNATDSIMHTELVNVWRDIDGDDTVNCVIIQGAGGKVFSAGGDFDLIEKNMKDFNALLRTWKEARDIVYNVINCSKPIVSTMRGPAVGAGLVYGGFLRVGVGESPGGVQRHVHPTVIDVVVRGQPGPDRGGRWLRQSSQDGLQIRERTHGAERVAAGRIWPIRCCRGWGRRHCYW